MDNPQPRIPQAVACRALGVSQSWFYKWKGGRPGPRAVRRDRVGADNNVTLCDLGIFVDQAAEPFSAQDADSRSFGGWAGAPGGRLLVERPVWSVSVVVIGVLAEDEPQVPFTSDQHAV